MNAFRRNLDRLLASTISLLLALMVAAVLWQVFTRFVIGRPSSFTEELVRYMMIWLGLLGAAYAAGRKAHLALDLFTAHLEGTRRRVSELVIHSAILLFALVVLLGGGCRLVWIQLALGQQSAALGVKLGYVYLAVPIAGLFIVLYSLMAIAGAWRQDDADATARPSAGLN
jgi:TRAP-type C4-dicarboxylate transport system permease small subunit